MIPTPGQSTKYYGIGAVSYRPGETVVWFERRKRRRYIAKLLEALLEKHPAGTYYVAWDNTKTHADDQAAGPPLSVDLQPRLNPSEMLWRHFRRKVTRCFDRHIR